MDVLAGREMWCLTIKSKHSHFSYLCCEVPEDVSSLSTNEVGWAKRAEPLSWVAGLAARL